MAVATKQYNDYELLYMIEEESKEALEIMVEKYKPLINSRLTKFRIKELCYDDYFQECLWILYEAIKKYDSGSKMSFTNFFDMMLQRRIIDMLRKNKKYFEKNVLCEDIDIVVAYKTNNDDENEEKIEELIDGLSKLEKEIFDLKFKNNVKSEDISTLLNIPKRSVYSACDRIRKKALTLK